jgi:hypothetical protein
LRAAFCFPAARSQRAEIPNSIQKEQHVINTVVPDTTPLPSTPKSWRDVLPIHPAAAAYPPIGKDELSELGRDIKARGLQVDVVLLLEDNSVSLLDGRNRLDALEANGFDLIKGGRLDRTLGLGAGSRVRVVTDIDPYEYAASFNAHRRHLTPEQKRERIEALLKSNPERSDREIAKELDTNHKIVGRTRKRMESTGTVSQLPKRIGQDGKARKQPAATPVKLSVVKAVDTAVVAKPAKTAAAARGDIGPASSGEVARLEALVEELRNKNRQLESKIIGLEGEIQDLKDARPAGAFAVLLSLAKAGADAAVLTANSPDLHVVVGWLIKAKIASTETTKPSEADRRPVRWLNQ